MFSDAISNIPGLTKFKDPSWRPGAWVCSFIVVLGWGSILVMGVTDPLGGINTLFPLFGNELPRDIVIVTINPTERDILPRTPVEIQDRINEISFNSSLQRELRAIQFVKRLSEEGRLTGRNMKEPLLHMIFDDELMTSLGSRSKMLPPPGLVARMFDAGRAAAQGFVDGSLADLGERDTVDLPALYG